MPSREKSVKTWGFACFLTSKKPFFVPHLSFLKAFSGLLRNHQERIALFYSILREILFQFQLFQLFFEGVSNSPDSIYNILIINY